MRGTTIMTHMRLSIVLSCSVLLFFAPAGSSPARAGSFSDMNKSFFYKISKPESIQRQENPFAEGASAAGDLAVEDLQLVGVVIGRDKAYALVSGYVVEKGDMLAGYKVTSVEMDQVVLKRLDEKVVLNLGSGQ